MTPFFYSQSMFAALAALPAVVLVGATLDVMSTADDSTRSLPARAAIRRSATMMLQGLPIAILLFVLFPRLAQPLWGLPSDHSAKDGLSDSMSPGEISELSLSDAVAFRVEFEAPCRPTATATGADPCSRVRRNQVDGVAIGMATRRARDRAIDRLHRHARAQQPAWLFALDLPARCRRPTTCRTLALHGAHHARPADPDLQAGDGDDAVRPALGAALVLSVDVAVDGPANLELGRGNERTIALARELREANPDPRAFIAAILRKFHDEEYVYTLATPFYASNPVDGFMFDGRRGFCEHFASAFVVMLRAGGIPARIVTGYQGGTINPRGNYMIVRQSDATAWAEALIDGQWQRFDPTAAVSPSRIEIGLGGACPPRIFHFSRDSMAVGSATSGSRGTRSTTTGAATWSDSTATGSATSSATGV
jgi:transglutaminase-like putative cysteine protease